jgi:hypothetical protein
MSERIATEVHIYQVGAFVHTLHLLRLAFQVSAKKDWCSQYLNGRNSVLIRRDKSYCIELAQIQVCKFVFLIVSLVPVAKVRKGLAYIKVECC